MGSLIYLLCTRLDLCFAVHKLVKFSSNPGKLQFEVLVHLLRYITDKNNLVLRHYAKIEDSPLSKLLIQARINTEKQLVVFHYYIFQYCPDTVRTTGEYIVFYQCGIIDHRTNVPVPVAQSSAES